MNRLAVSLRRKSRFSASSSSSSWQRTSATSSHARSIPGASDSVVQLQTLTSSGLFRPCDRTSQSRSRCTGNSSGYGRNVRGICSEAERECMEYDVVIVGAGPAGLSAAIRLKQLCSEKGVDLSVCVVEKGAEVGAHIISGNVFEPRALDELLPEWRKEEAPITVSVSSDKFWFLTKDRAFSLPSPFDNRNNYVISLSQLVRWLGSKAEEYGVEIYPGFSASEILYDDNGNVVGIGTNDMGIAKNGSKKENFQRGVELKGRVTLLAEGCRGSLSEKIIKKYKLREKRNAQHQTYALGIKEVWEIDESKHTPGAVIHTLGWPLDHKTYGGSFLYHMDERQVALGLVVALNYRNPYLNPYEEFQKLKHHPAIKPILEDGTVIQYGARTLNEGGIQSVPYPVFPGGAIIGCSAGFLNVPKIKGTHTAMKSGMLAAEAAFGTVHESSNLDSYWKTLQNSWVWEELHRARNYRPAFDHGLIPGLAVSAVEHYLFKGKSPFTLKHGKPDHESTDVASSHSPIEYPKPDGVLTFDVPTSLHRSNTNHDHDQPPHLKLRDPSVPSRVNLPEYSGPESRYCPARVYEYIPDEKGELKLQINAQNCLHCKACDIKDPNQNIEWTVPEGGGGPGYSVM
ncbi:Electron transfer flavoprotein-ubiquinone oxidoreductase, mitochondrial [Linum perenne]